MNIKRNNALNKIIVVIFLITSIFFISFLKQNTTSNNKYPNVELNNAEVRELVSSSTGYKYKIYVKFSRHYYERNKNYPALYILDAETNFGGVSYIVQRLIKDQIIPEIIEYETHRTILGKRFTKGLRFLYSESE